MHTVRNSFLILFAILIDLLQAGISAGLFFMGAFPVSTVGGAAGCIFGKYIGGTLACGVIGGIVGFVGAPANAPVAIATLPFAIGVGMAINFCLDIFPGLILVGFLWIFGMYHKGIGIGGFLIELTPGLSNIPGWTAMTILCVVRKTAEEKKLVGSSGGMFTTLMTTGITGAGAFAAFALNSSTQRRGRDQGVYTQEQQDQEVAEKKQFVSTELKNIDGIRAANRTPANDNQVESKSLKYAA